LLLLFVHVTAILFEGITLAMIALSVKQVGVESTAIFLVTTELLHQLHHPLFFALVFVIMDILGKVVTCLAHLIIIMQQCRKLSAVDTVLASLALTAQQVFVLVTRITTVLIAVCTATLQRAAFQTPTPHHSLLSSRNSTLIDINVTLPLELVNVLKEMSSTMASGNTPGYQKMIIIVTSRMSALQHALMDILVSSAIANVSVLLDVVLVIATVEFVLASQIALLECFVRDVRKEEVVKIVLSSTNTPFLVIKSVQWLFHPHQRV
jgi:hypothetical protein